MRILKGTYIVILFFVCHLLFATETSAMQPLDVIKEPVYPVSPIENTPIKVNSEDISIHLNHEQAGIVTHSMELENTSDEPTTLSFIFPESMSPDYNYYRNYDVKLDENTLVSKSYTVFNPGLENQTSYGLPYDYTLLAELLEYKSRDDIYEGKMVSVYHIQGSEEVVNLEINYTDQSKIISNSDKMSSMRKQDGTSNKVEREFVIEDFIIIDVNNDIDVKVDDEVIEPVTGLSFSDAMKGMIQKETYKQLTADNLNLFYNILIYNNDLSETFNVIDRNYYDDQYELSQYTLTLQEKEIQNLTINYEVDPSYYPTKTERYYTYKLVPNKVNKDAWHSYGEVSVTVLLNSEYRYIPQSSFELTKDHNDLIYKGTLDQNQGGIISFSTYTSDEVPSAYSGMFEGLGKALLIGLIIILVLILIIVIVITLVIIWIVKSVKNKRHITSSNKKNYDGSK